MTTPEWMPNDPPVALAPAPAPEASPAPSPDRAALERRGRAWLIWSFLACPCHLPLTLGLLGMVLGGTAAGALLRSNAWLAGGVIAAVWVAGTARGLWLVRKAERGELTCAIPARGRSRSTT